MAARNAIGPPDRARSKNQGFTRPGMPRRRAKPVVHYHHMSRNQPVVPWIELVRVLVFADLDIRVHGPKLFVIPYDVVHRPGGFLRLRAIAGQQLAVDLVDAPEDLVGDAGFVSQFQNGFAELANLFRRDAVGQIV